MNKEKKRLEGTQSGHEENGNWGKKQDDLQSYRSSVGGIQLAIWVIISGGEFVGAFSNSLFIHFVHLHRLDMQFFVTILLCQFAFNCIMSNIYCHWAIYMINTGQRYDAAKYPIPRTGGCSRSDDSAAPPHSRPGAGPATHPPGLGSTLPLALSHFTE